MPVHELPAEQGPPAAHVCVVYDPTDGSVVLIHECLRRGCDPAECSRMALATVQPVLESIKSLGASQWGTLRILHLAHRLRLDPGSRFRVDLATNELVSAESW
jgi:hypothetical protein